MFSLKSHFQMISHQVSDVMVHYISLQSLREPKGYFKSFQTWLSMVDIALVVFSDGQSVKLTVDKLPLNQ